jgi:hypothetical protein
MAVTSTGANDSASVPGLIAAATWAIGLAVGVAALIAGHVQMAAIALLVAVTAPLLGLAWVSRGKDGAARLGARRLQVMGH